MEYRVAVVGTGSIGMRHLALLKEMQGVKPIAIPKRKERKTELQSQGWQVASSLKEAAEEGVQLAIIASNTDQHSEDALEAIHFGMNLLVEKPLSVDATTAYNVYKAACEKEKKIFVGCVLRCSKTLQIFREWLPKIGKVYSVRIECQSFLPYWRPTHPYRQSYSAQKASGGVLRDLIHEIDYAAWIFGFPKQVQAKLKNTGQLDIEAEEFVELWWDVDGISVSICLDYLSKVPRRRMSAFGEKGNLEWDGRARKTWIDIPNHPKEEVLEQDLGAIFKTQLEEWIRVCLRSDPNTFLATAKEGVHSLAICDAARLASEHQRQEEIRYL